jgi:hypothetical protein
MRLLKYSIPEKFNMLLLVTLSVVAFTIPAQVVSIWLPLIQLGKNCCSFVTKFASGIVTHCAFEGENFKTSTKKRRISFFIMERFKIKFSVLIIKCRNFYPEKIQKKIAANKTFKILIHKFGIIFSDDKDTVKKRNSEGIGQCSCKYSSRHFGTS